MVLICILPVFDIYDNIHISKNHSLKLLLMYKEFDVVLVKTCDFFLHKFLRGKWKRSSNQRMRTWYHYRHYGYLIEKYRGKTKPAIVLGGNGCTDPQEIEDTLRKYHLI